MERTNLESSLLYTREDGKQDFVHDSYRDFFLAKTLAEKGVDLQEIISKIKNQLIYSFYSSMLKDSTDLVNSLLDVKSEEKRYGVTFELPIVGSGEKGRSFSHMFTKPVTLDLAIESIVSSQQVSQDAIKRCYDKLMQLPPDAVCEWVKKEPLVILGQYLHRNGLGGLEEQLINEMIKVIFDQEVSLIAREHYAMNLPKINPEKIASFMINYLNNKNNKDRGMAALILGFAGLPQCVDPLLDFVVEKGNDRYWVGVDALIRINTPEAIDGLLRISKSRAEIADYVVYSLDKTKWIPNDEQAEKYLEAKGVDVALLRLTHRNLKGIDLLTYVGNLLVNRGGNEQAVSLLKTALRIDSNYFEANYNLARALMNQGSFDEAEDYYQKSLKLNECEDLWMDYGLFYIKQEKFDRAKKVIEKGISKYPCRAGMYHNLAIAELGMENLDNAIEALQKALDLEPGRKNSESLLTAVKLTFDDNKDFIKEAKNLSEGCLNGLKWSQVNYMAGNKRRSIYHLEKVLESDSDNILALSCMGAVYKDLGELDKAEEYLKSAIAVNPQFINAYANLADVYQLKGEKQKMLEVVKKIEEFRK